MMTESTSPHSQRTPSGERDVHRNYGLRITHVMRGSSANPRSDIRPRMFTFYSLCHLIEGDGWFWREGEGVKPVVPGEGVLAEPHTIVDYGGQTCNWVEDYVCFCGPIADQLVKTGILATGIVQIGLSRRLLPIIERSLDPSDDAQIEANVWLQKLLVDLYLERKQAAVPEREDRLRSLRSMLTEQVDRWWTVEEMAAYCNMSCNHFRNLFKSQTGMTPKNYVEKLKMTRAAEQICSHDKPIVRVAENFGFRDPYHFSRVFKRVMGLAPQHYRDAHQRSS